MNRQHYPKMSEARKGNTNALGKHWKMKDTSAKKGNKNAVGERSEATKIKIGEARKGKHWKNKGKHYPKLSEARKGEKNPNWKGGISLEPYTTDWTKSLKRAIRERDHYTCRLCGKQQEDITFNIHHIDYDKKNCNLDNLITLCNSCHSKTNFNREYWEKFFKEFLKGE